MVLIITFVMRHQLTRVATKDLLSILELHCLTPNLCRSSMHLFYNFFTESTSPVQKHYFCDFCKGYLGTVSMKECALCSKKKEKYFMYIPLAGQLQSILSGNVYHLHKLQMVIAKQRTMIYKLHSGYGPTVFVGCLVVLWLLA